MVFKTPEHGHFCQIVLILYNSAGKFLNKTLITSMFHVTTNGGDRPRAAAFGRGPGPLFGYVNSLWPLPSAAAIGRFGGRRRKNRSRLPAL